MTDSKFLARQLSSWFKSSKRDLPWRHDINPYKVWISEVMLQQTQVKTVIPYFHRWMKAFPTITHLANAPIEQVIKIWEGLGYYSRARNLHKGSKEIVSKYHGKLPSNSEDLLQISGIGPYTCSAILSFAFQKECCLVDGNVKRVMSRFLHLEVDYSKSSHYRLLEEELTKALPKHEPWVFNEALMELGALICTPKNPHCSKCPLQKKCMAKLNNNQLKLPLVKVRPKVSHLNRAVLIFQYDQEFLIQKQTSDLMKDLHEFFYFEFDPNISVEKHEKFKEWQSFSIGLSKLPLVRHSFTRFKVSLYPFVIKLKEKKTFENFEWMSLKEVKLRPFSSGHRKVLAHLEDFLSCCNDFNSQNLAYFSKV